MAFGAANCQPLEAARDMMLKLSQLYLFLGLIIPALAQEFCITNDGGDYPLVSGYSGKVYYYTYYRNEVRVLSKDLMTSQLTKLPSLPFFINDSPIAISQASPFLNDNGFVYEFNESTDDTFFLFDAEADSLISGERILLISPTGKNVLIYDRRPDIYNFEDESITIVDIHMDVLTKCITWGANDSIIYYVETLGGGLLLEGNTYSNKIDTILNILPYGSIDKIDYSNISNSIAVSYRNTSIGSKIDIIDLNDNSISNIYDPFKTDDPFDGGIIKDLKYSPDNRYLVFFELRIDSEFGGLFLYNTISEELYHPNEMSNLKHITWLNNDTIIYSHGITNGLYGYSVLAITPVHSTIEDFHSVVEKVKAYPNPFNSSIKIELLFRKTEDPKIEIYNIIGKRIDNLNYYNILKSNSSFTWEPSSTISSGVYFIQVLNGGFRFVTKVLYIQ